MSDGLNKPDPQAMMDEIALLRAENEGLRTKYASSTLYIRTKVNQLLTVMGTSPLNPDELDDSTLIETDPIGTVSDSFVQILRHLHRTNEKLRFANMEIQAIFDAAEMGILVIGRDMKVTAYNRKLKEIFFKDQEDATGLLCHDIICQLGDKGCECPFMEVFRTGQSTRQEQWRLKDSYYDVVASPIRTVDGEITNIVIVYMDITVRMLAERARAKSDERYRDLFENANDMIQVVGPDGSIMYVNSAWRQALGHSEEDLVNITIFDVIHPDCHDCEPDFKNVVCGDSSGRIETEFITKDRRKIIVEGSVSMIFEDEVFAGTRGIFRDITERKVAEERIMDSLKEKDVLLKEIHHRVKNNMAVMASLLKMQMAYVTDDKYRQMFLESLSRIRSMALVHEKLYQSKDFTKIDVVDYIKSLAENIREAFRGGRHVRVLINAEDVGLDIEVMIPCGLIINELLTNSFRHAFEDNDDPEIRLSLVSKGDRMARLTVSDNGKGVPDDLMGGSAGGLGLKLVKALASQIEGDMEFDNEDGFCLDITFPTSIEYAKK